ncbi:alpha/beta fold hydrolase [Frisingicoccus sp.]|uniref:alpha/beta fold hydrolase n=1 Tax=Frisingicoccus sp. TaxID=1918627 RepID=UPI002E7A2FBD|nr:alpha/beta hydrolase [Frisingicoccus sp.]MEE0753175.1 alpha/beta hydrolase [Frisingicoccus sp.]
MEHKQMTASGGTVHYWVDRAGMNSDCIVFTHGVTADHTMFEKQVRFFSGKYTLILWDVPLHGLSRPYHGFSYRDTADILYSILRKEKIEKAVLVGMSMGGYPSQHFGALYPEMVSGFVALDTTPLGVRYYSKSDLWWLRQAAPMAKWFPDEILRKSMAWSVSQTKYAYQKMMAMLKPLSKADIIEQMEIAYTYLTLENKDVSFKFPVLILVGEKDSTGKVKAYCKAWAEQTGYPLHFIKGAKHFANGDNPEQVNREIDSFVNRLRKEEGKS